MIIAKVFAFIYGSLIGSFMNVVIYRWPRSLSVVRPRSNCTSCGYKIPWYRNIPIISYLMIKGKCVKCLSKISIRYFIVELILGVVAVLTFPDQISFHHISLYLIQFLIFAIFVAHIFIDLEHKLLLDKLNIALLVLAMIFVILNQTYFKSILGLIVGFFVPYLITWLFYKLRGQIGLGGGDIKLFGIIGFMFGFQEVILNIFASSFLGSIIGIALMSLGVMKRNESLPFGPFILIVATVQLYIPDVLSRLYLNFINN